MRAHDLRTAVRNQVAEVVGDQSIIERHEHGADLRYRVERLELRVDVGGDVGDAIAFPDARALQPSRPSIAAIPELRVGEAKAPVDERGTIRVQPPGAPEELERRQRYFHEW